MPTKTSRVAVRVHASQALTSARQSTLRETNLALVVQTVFGSPTPLSRAGVAAATSMTRSTVSRLVDDLIAGGVLTELEQPAVIGPGRPAIPLSPGTGLAALGLQVNAGYLAARVLDLRGQVVSERLEDGDFVSSNPTATLSRLGRLASEVLGDVPDGVRLVGAGLALPGIVSAGSGHLLLAPNLGWSDVDPAQHLGPDVLGSLALRVGNEADLAARTVAETAPGRMGPLRDFIYLSGEIGIGGAAVLDGQVMTGRHGWAGEIGHVCVDPSGPQCRCGSTGCLERYAGRQALLEEAGLSTDAGPRELEEAFRAGEPAALRAVQRAARALGVALAGVVNVLDIPVIVLGGHLGQVGELLRPELERQLRARVLSAHWVEPSIETADGDPAPGATGAALLELSKVLREPARWLERAPA